MAQWPALYGVFRHDDDESRLIEGIKAVLNGEQTAELSVMHPAMYAADHASTPVENSPLTERECEVPQRTALRRDEPGYRPRAVYQREHGADAPVQCVS